MLASSATEVPTVATAPHATPSAGSHTVILQVWAAAKRTSNGRTLPHMAIGEAQSLTSAPRGIGIRPHSPLTQDRGHDGRPGPEGPYVAQDPQAR